MNNEPEAAAADRPSITFESLTFSDGTTIALDPRDVVVFVGPNNAGKSAALREVEEHIGRPGAPQVITSASLRRVGTVEHLRSFIEDRSRRVPQGPSHFLYKGFGFSIWAHELERLWAADLSQLRGLFCRRMATEKRIIDSNPVNAIPILEEPPTRPVHLLFVDDRIEQRLSEYFRRAFNQDLVLFRMGGSQWPLVVGDRPSPELGENRVSTTYNDRLRSTTTPLQTQGDGMRSFASVILDMLAPDTPSVLILDEPEAFLHPPQARLLGEFIAKERPPTAQLFVATHSPDVLDGLLGAAAEHVRVVRIQRDGLRNRVKELDKEHARKIGNDPVMKFSGVMSGVFHERVIVCESDADCMFYSSILDLPTVRGEHQPDVLFVHAGGKHRMATLAEALRALGVRVDVIADMDVLSEKLTMKRLVIALGGDWSAAAVDARPLKMAIEQHKPSMNAQEVANGVRGVLNTAPATGEFPRNLRSEIEAIFRKASPWDAVKEAGQAAIPAGQPTQHYKNLLATCNAIGFWIVPVGEIEGFCKTDGGHGSQWVQKVLARDLATDPELRSAREFISEVWGRGPR